MEESTELRLDEQNWKVILRDLYRNIILMVMAAAIVMMGVRIYKNTVFKSEYTTSATLMVSMRGGADSSTSFSLSTANEIAQVYASVFEDEIGKATFAELIGDISPDVNISASVIPETNLLEVKTTGPTSKESYMAMEAVLKNYQTVADYLFGNAVMEVIMDPQVPVAPSNTLQAGRLMKLGGLAGIVMMAGIIVLCSIFRKTIKTPEAAKRHLKGERLVTFLHEEKNRTWNARMKKLYKGLLLTNPMISFRFEESCHQLAARLEYRLKLKKEKSIMITSVAENEGKSTVAVNLAIALARRNHKVVVIDADLPKPALYKLLENQMTGKEGLIEYLKGNATLDKILCHDEKSGIYAVMNKKSVGGSHKHLNSDKFQMLLQACEKVFDYVIIDTSPISAGTDAERLLEYVDTTMLVIRQDRVDAEDINDAIDTMKSGKSRFLGYVLNDFDDKAGSNGGNYRYGYGNYKQNGRENKQ